MINSQPPGGMRRPFIVAHLSDLHISLEHKGRSIRSTRRVIERALEHSIDHMVVTGDITANGTQRELELARTIFASYGLLDTRRLTVIPGNHDVFGGVHTAEDVLSFPRRCKKVDYDAAVKRFCQSFTELFEQTIAPGLPKRFPFVKRLGPLVLFGLNSVARYSKLKNPFGSNGAVNRLQRVLLENLLHADVFRDAHKLILIHHHFSRTPRATAGTMEYLWRTIERRTMKLHKKRKLLRLFARSGVSAVLHGHIHENQEYRRDGVLFLNSGASVIGHDKELSYRLVVLHDGMVETSLHHLASTSEASAKVHLLQPALRL